MGKFWRIARSVLVGLIAILAAGVAVAYAVSERALRRIYPTPSDAVAIPSDSSAVERGRHIVHAIGTCTTCHGDDLGGAVYADMGPIGVVAGPNLTRAPSGRGSQFDDTDWIRAIRYGTRRDGRSLIAMPSEVFTNLSDADLGAVVAYLKQVSPVDRTVPTSRFGLIGRVLLAAGKLSVLTAPKTHHGESLWSGSGPDSASREYGHYLVEVAGCAGCHGHGLSGGLVAGPPGLPPAANLTPTGLAGWTEADFAKVLREGVKRDGTSLNSFMPWKTYAGMTDLELHSIWRYLESVPPRPFGNK